jgi:hypothetical protein
LGVGEKKEISIKHKSPSVGGRYKLFWAMMSPGGVKIGRRVSCAIYTGMEEVLKTTYVTGFMLSCSSRTNPTRRKGDQRENG